MHDSHNSIKRQLTTNLMEKATKEAKAEGSVTKLRLTPLTLSYARMSSVHANERDRSNEKGSRQRQVALQSQEGGD
jgi:hypothetical protein